MKKILLFFLVSTLIGAANAQLVNKTARITQYFQPPRLVDTPTGVIPIGSLMIRSTDNTLWLRGATQWIGVGNGNSALSFQNGLTHSGGVIKLGGTLTGYTEFNGNNFDLALGTNNSPLGSLNIATNGGVNISSGGGFYLNAFQGSGANSGYFEVSPSEFQMNAFRGGISRSIKLDTSGFKFRKNGFATVAIIRDIPRTTVAFPSLVYDTITKEFKYNYITGGGTIPTLTQVLTAGNQAATQGINISALALDYTAFKNIGGSYAVNLNPVNQSFSANYTLLLPLENDTLTTRTWVRNYFASNGGGGGGSIYQFSNGLVNDGSGNISLGGTLTNNTAIRLGNGSSPALAFNNSSNAPLAFFGDNSVHFRIGSSTTTLGTTGLEVNASQPGTSHKTITDTSGFRIVRNNGLVATIRTMPRTTTAFPAVVYDTISKEFKYNYISPGVSTAGLDDVLAVSNTSTRDILTTGNVGIGTTAPGYRLDVRGGGLRVGNNLFVVDSSGNRVTSAINYSDGSSANFSTFYQNNGFGFATYSPSSGVNYRNSIEIRRGSGGIYLYSNKYDGGESGVIQVSPFGASLQSDLGSTSSRFDVLQSGTKYTSNAPGGIKYDADYSTGYTVRSLIDKGYLDTRLAGLGGGTTYTAGSGLALSGTQFRLASGTLANNFDLNANNYHVSFFDANGFIISVVGSSVAAFEASQTATYVQHDDEVQINAPKVNIAGAVKINDGTQANGYVLTTDSTGTASWKLPVLPLTINNSNSPVSLYIDNGVLRANLDNWNYQAGSNWRNIINTDSTALLKGKADSIYYYASESLPGKIVLKKKGQYDTLSTGANPAGNDGELQWKNGSSLGASSNLYWNSGTNKLGINTNAPTQAITLGNGGNMLLTPVGSGTYEASGAIIFNALYEGTQLPFTIRQEQPVPGDQRIAFRDYSNAERLIVSQEGIRTFGGIDVLGNNYTPHSALKLTKRASGDYSALSFQYGANVRTHYIGTAPDNYLRITRDGNNDIVIKPNGNIGINTDEPNASAILHINSTNKGVLLATMTKAQRDAISSPANGLSVMVVDGEYGTYLSYYDGAGWRKISSSTD